MLAALGTLPFLATIWLVVVLGARILEESGAKIAAALKGEQSQPPITASRVRIRTGRIALKRTCVEWRAAA